MDLMTMENAGLLKLSNRSKWRLKVFTILVMISSFGGPLYITLFGGLDENLVIWHTMVTGIIGGSTIWGFEILLVPGRYGEAIRRLPFFAASLLRLALMIAVVIIVGPLSQWIVGGPFEPLISFRAGPGLFIYVTSIAFVLLSFTQIVRIVGGRVLFNILVGRYIRPVREDRIFLFLDIKDSTPLSEKLGDLGVQELIAQFFFDITEPILEWGGEVHRYIGDEVVVTWFSKDGLKDARCLNCCFAIQERINERAERYLEKFGVVPEFRIGLHSGPVVASQCGDIKQEVVFFGDTINTTARIEQYCKTVDKPLLVSADLYQQLPANDHWQVTDVGSVVLRGRREEMTLFAVENGTPV
ncbi:MAG: adenylate/guanylate cyclase domain-containing protein [Alphaproteobacteria bacterium]|jgi:adenylate cyclase|nr:adenylate/guanylate cyclase domain-containing protein [Alphaproteobacteria bacterium]